MPVSDSARKVIGSACAVALLITLYQIFQYVRKYDPALEYAAVKDLHDISIRLEGAHVVSRTTGINNWMADADHVEVHRVGAYSLDSYSTVTFTSVKNGKTFHNGKLDGKFECRLGVWDQTTQEFKMTEGLMYESTSGDKLTADSCVWSEKKDDVRLERGVSGKIEGKRFSSPYVLMSPRQRLLNCPQGAEIEGKDFHVMCGRMIWDIGSRYARCDGQITGDRARDTFLADSAELWFDKYRGKADQQGGLSRFVANTGSLRLRIDDDTMLSDTGR